MPAFDTSRLLATLGEDHPCGPDLDLAGDADFLNFVNLAEGTLPASFGEFSSAREPFDFKPLLASAEALSARTHDLRILVPVAKMQILDRDLPAFVAILKIIAQLLSEHWDHVHPLASGDDGAYRLSILQTLDDMPHTVLPLQAAPVLETRRIRLFSYRLHQVAKGRLQPRSGEEVVSADLVDSTIRTLELPVLVEVRDRVGELVAVLERLPALWLEKTGKHEGLSLDRLTEMAREVLAFVGSLIHTVDPSSALAPANAEHDDDDPSASAFAGSRRPSGIDAGSVVSLPIAASALQAVVEYFAAREPASPALLIVSQASKLVGKSFIETVKALVPSFAGRTNIQIGWSDAFSLNAEALSELSADLAQKLPAPAAGQAMTFSVATRHEAITLMGQIAAYFQSADPSSAIPLLMDKARAMTGRDFVAILKEALPPAAFSDD